MWLKRILRDLGYKMKKTIFHQENESIEKMERNRLRSCGDKSRHISIRYFFIKDVLEREKIDLRHCGTEYMIADFLTKPLQGSLFRRIRDIIMDHTSFPTEERVVNCRNMSEIAVEIKSDIGKKKLTYSEILKRGKVKEIKKCRQKCR